MTPDLYRCDLCGEQADTVHFLRGNAELYDHEDRGPNVEAIESGDAKVMFACPEHDCGGYGLPLKEWETDDTQDHLKDKVWGWTFLFGMELRQNALLHDAAELDNIKWAIQTH
jgi:hypothetical protein